MGTRVEIQNQGDGGLTAQVSAAGALKVDSSAVTQPVSGTTTANQGTANTTANAWPVKVTDATNAVTLYTAGSSNAVPVSEVMPVAAKIVHATVTAGAGTTTIPTNSTFRGTLTLNATLTNATTVVNATPNVVSSGSGITPIATLIQTPLSVTGSATSPGNTVVSATIPLNVVTAGTVATLTLNLNSASAASFTLQGILL